MKVKQNELLEKLRAPFDGSDIEWRVGSTSKDKKRGLLLPYVTNRAIMNRLDDVLGVMNWKQQFREVHNGIICALSIRLEDDGEWITKEDGADLTNIEATKGGLSDSMKRAAVQFGMGRHLYEAESVWVEIDEYKRPKTKPSSVIYKKHDKEKSVTPTMSIEDACHKLKVCTSLENLQKVWGELPQNIKADNEVIAKKDEMKNKLTK